MLLGTPIKVTVGTAIGDPVDAEEERELAARAGGGDRELPAADPARGRGRRRALTGRQAHDRPEPGHPPGRLDHLHRAAAARQRHPHRDAGRRGVREVPDRRRAAAGDAADRQALPQHDHLAHQGHGGARHRREARAAGRPLQAAPAGQDHRLPRLGHAERRTARTRSSAFSTRSRSASSSASCASTSSGSRKTSCGASASTSPSPTAWCSSPARPGRGKTTTLYAALSEIKSIEDKIITIEDPVEYQLKGHHADPDQREEGADVRARPAVDPAPRSRQDHGRRDPRPGDGADRDPVGADRPPRVHDRPRQQRPRRARAVPEHGRRAVPVRLGAELRAGAAAGAQHLRPLQAAGERSPPRMLAGVGARPVARAQRAVLRRAPAASSAAAPATRGARRSASCST